MTTPDQTIDVNASSTDTAHVTHALLERLDRTDRALRRWRLAAQVCAGAILFGAGIAAGGAQSGKDASQPKQGQSSQPASSQGKSSQSSQQAPDAQDPSAAGAAPQAAAPQAAQAQGAARGGSRMVGIALDLNPSGRWNSTLLAVDEDGIVYALNTAGPKPMWQRFTYSP